MHSAFIYEASILDLWLLLLQDIFAAENFLYLETHVLLD